MKYQNLASFQKHLAGAAPHHFCKCYLIIIPNDYERRKVVKTLLLSIAAPDSSPIFLSGADVDSVQILDSLSPPLFGEDPISVVDELEKMGKKEMEILGKNLPTSGYLLLGSRGKVAISKSVEKEGVILDLTEEKPWDRERRLALQMSQKVAETGKRLADDAAPILLARLGSDPALIDQEIDKLLCFVGDRPTIETSDIYSISKELSSQTLWQIAEEIIWGEGRLTSVDEISFHGLIPLLRSQLEIGAKIGSLLTSGVPFGDWTKSLPKIWPKTLEKRRYFVERHGSEFFEKGLKLLFEIELMSRTGSNHLETLFDYFRIRLTTYAR